MSPPQRSALALVLALITPMGPATGAEPVAIGVPFDFAPEGVETAGKLRLRGALRVQHTAVDGFSVREISGLAWDSDEQILYGLSDDGYLVHLRPVFENGRLRGLHFLAAYGLRGPDGARLAGDESDTEGLAALGVRNAVRGDTVLLVAMDKRAWVGRFSPRGEWLGSIPHRGPIESPQRFEQPDELVEAIALTPRQQMVLLPERPLKGGDGVVPVLVDGQARGVFPLRDPKYSIVVAAEFTESAELVVLERVHRSILRPTLFVLRRIPALGRGQDTLSSELLVEFSSRGDYRIDNFEALARHEGNAFFMMSDDNENVIQKTLLIYFTL